MSKLFEKNKDSNSNSYVEISGPQTPNEWKDARITLIPEGNGPKGRPVIRLYNWRGDGPGKGSVDIPLDAIPPLKEAISYLIIEEANSLE